MPEQKIKGRTFEDDQEDVQFALLRLLALATDIRQMLSPQQIRGIPALSMALDALDELFEQQYNDLPVGDPEKAPSR